MSFISEQIEQKKAEFLSELKEFLSIASVSTAPENTGDVQRCAEWLAAHIRTIGFSDVRIMPTEGHPIVYAQNLEAGENAPTVLFYGHYDVQPVDPLNLWTNAPFDPTVRDGRIYARGATDDKGQVFLHLKALQLIHQRDGKFPVNIKLLIEGEEEIGSPSLDAFLRENAEMLSCDAVAISDTSMYRPGVPTITYGLRGLCYVEVEVTGPNRDLHSGSFGGAVENPINALCAMIAKLKDDRKKITIPGFYDNVIELSTGEREKFAQLPFEEQEFCAQLDVTESSGEEGFSTLERLWARPTLDVNGIWGGFTGEGAKTVLPSKAHAKISMRLVPGQKSIDISQKIGSYLEKIAPPTVKVKVEYLHGADPVLAPLDSSGVRAAQRALRSAFGKETVFIREGGSIPVVLTFDQILGAPTVLMGFGLNSENAHSPDEHFHLEHFYKGIEAAAYFYEEMAKEKKPVEETSMASA